MTTPRLAIIVYVDDSIKLLKEFTWLYHTWKKYNLDSVSDIFLGHYGLEPSLLEKFDGIYAVESKPFCDVTPRYGRVGDWGVVPVEDAFGFKMQFPNGYRYSNSIGFFRDPTIIDMIKSKTYSHILKTDSDVFLTKNLKEGFNKSNPIFGYAAPNIFNKLAISFMTAVLGGQTMQCPNLGSSFIMRSVLVEKFSERVIFFMDDLLRQSIRISDEFTMDWDGQGIYAPALNMYASSLAANEYYTWGVDRGFLDINSTVHYEVEHSDIWHIHAYHADNIFSKQDFHTNVYTDEIINKATTDFVPDFCLRNAAEARISFPEIWNLNH